MIKDKGQSSQNAYTAILPLSARYASALFPFWRYQSLKGYLVLICISLPSEIHSVFSISLLGFSKCFVNCLFILGYLGSYFLKISFLLLLDLSCVKVENSVADIPFVN